MADPKRILIIRPSALGDVCRTVPVLASLRRAFPRATIDWVVRDQFVSAVAAHPALSETIPFPRGRFARWWRSPKTAGEFRGWCAELRKRNYDIVLDCQGLFRSGFMTVISGAPMRIGHRDARELAWLAYNERVTCPPNTHTVDRMLSLLKPIGVEPVHDMQLYVPQTDRAWWRTVAQEKNYASGTYAVLAPTSRWLSKRWPIERWAELIDPLRERGFDRCVIIGAPGEETQVAPLFDCFERAGVQSENIIDVVGKTTVGQTLAVLAEAGLVIANDSAPLHMAVGFSVPCVALFGPTNPELVGPYGKLDCVVQKTASENQQQHFKDASLGDALMQGILVEDVHAKMDYVLGSVPTVIHKDQSVAS